MFINKTKKQLITMMSLIAGVALILCVALGFVDSKVRDKAFASVETLDGVTFLETKSWGSADEGDDKCMLLVTGFSAPTILADTTNTYILGYEVNGADTFDDYGKKYYEGVTVKKSGGTATYSAADIYGETYADYYLIVYEIKAYSASNNYHVKAFIKQIEPDDVDGYETSKAAYGVPYGSPVSVTYNDTPNAEFSGAIKTLYNADYSFSVTPNDGYAVDVYVNDSLVEPAEGVYTVAGSAVTEDLDILLDAYSTTDVIYDFEDATQPLDRHFAVTYGELVQNPVSTQAYSGTYSAKFVLSGQWYHSITINNIRTKIALLQANPTYAAYNVLSFKLYVDGAGWQIGDGSTNKIFGIDLSTRYASGASGVWTNISVPVASMNSDSFDLFINQSSAIAYVDDIVLLKSAIEGGVVYAFEDYDDGTDITSEFNKTATIATDYTVGNVGKSVKITVANASSTLTFNNFNNRLAFARVVNPDADMLQFKVRVVANSNTTWKVDPESNASHKIFGAAIYARNRSQDGVWTTVRVPLSSITSNQIIYLTNGNHSLYLDDMRLVKSVSSDYAYSLYSFEDADERAAISANMASYFTFDRAAATLSLTQDYATTHSGYSLKIDGVTNGSNGRAGIFTIVSLIDKINVAKELDGATFNTITFSVRSPLGTSQFGGDSAYTVFGSQLEDTRAKAADTGWTTISVSLSSLSDSTAPIAENFVKYFAATTATTIYIDDIKLVTV